MELFPQTFNYTRDLSGLVVKAAMNDNVTIFGPLPRNVPYLIINNYVIKDGAGTLGVRIISLFTI